MMLVDDVLDAWRDAERLLETLPPVSPDHETVAMAVERLRETYQRLTTEDAPRTAGSVAEAQDAIERTRLLLDWVRTRDPDRSRASGG